MVPVVLAGQGRKSLLHPLLDPKALEFPLPKLMMSHPPAQESIGLSVGSNVVTVLGRERNTDAGRGITFSNQIPSSKSHPSCLRRECHPK